MIKNQTIKFYVKKAIFLKQTIMEIMICVDQFATDIHYRPQHSSHSLRHQICYTFTYLTNHLFQSDKKNFKDWVFCKSQNARLSPGRKNSLEIKKYSSFILPFSAKKSTYIDNILLFFIKKNIMFIRSHEAQVVFHSTYSTGKFIKL